MRTRPSERFEVTVDDALVAAFRRDGFASIERITTDAEVDWLREVFDELFADRRGGIPGGYFDLSRPYDAEGPDHLPQVLFPESAVPELKATRLQANARAIAAALLGVDADLLHSWGHMIHKPARHGEQIPWHQDEAYWEPHLDYLAVGVWVPLDDVDLANGCMCFLPGTHLGPVRVHRHIDDDPAVHGLVTDDVDPTTMVPVPLAAGGATFHHPRTLHHTPPNRSDRDRRAVATEYQTPPTRRDVPAHRPWVDEGRVAWDARTIYEESP